MRYPLGLNDTSCTLPFYGSDQEENFNKIKKIMPPEWRWHSHPIEYTFNSLGHRNNFDVKDVDVSNMTAIIGCSHIEGTGVSNKMTVPHIYERLTGEKTYNMGQGGVDNHIIFINALWAHQQGFKKVIVSWTQPERNFMFNHLSDPEIYRGPHVNPDLYYKYFTDDYTFENPHWEYRLDTFNNVLGAFNIKTFHHFQGGHDDNVRLWEPIWKRFSEHNVRLLSKMITEPNTLNILFARDIIHTGNDTYSSHYGPFINERIARDMIAESR